MRKAYLFSIIRYPEDTLVSCLIYLQERGKLGECGLYPKGFAVLIHFFYNPEIGIPKRGGYLLYLYLFNKAGICRTIGMFLINSRV